MSNLTDSICKCRDILTNPKLTNRLPWACGTNGLFDRTVQEVHRQCTRKAKDRSYELTFTYQDLMEWSEDMHSLLDRWDTKLQPKKNIKRLIKQAEETRGMVNYDKFTEEVLPIIGLRRDCMPCLVRTLSTLEYYCTWLYFVEIVSKDKFALQFTQRFDNFVV